jgi:serine protease AprX
MALSGTSMSTPMVSGALALLLEKYPNLTPNDVKYRLKLSATDLNQPKNQQGWGLLNIEKLIEED